MNINSTTNILICVDYFVNICISERKRFDGFSLYRQENRLKRPQDIKEKSLKTLIL